MSALLRKGPLTQEDVIELAERIWREDAKRYQALSGRMESLLALLAADPVVSRRYSLDAPVPRRRKLGFQRRLGLAWRLLRE